MDFSCRLSPPRTPPRPARSRPPPSFEQALRVARTAAVVRIEEIRLKEKGPQELIVTPEFEAEVRVTETLFGDASKVSTLSFSGQWCGGHFLQVGEYYVLLLRENIASVELAPSAPSIVYLFGEYNEHEGSTGSRSVLLLHLRNFVRNGHFPEAFPIRMYLEQTSAHAPSPPRP